MISQICQVGLGGIIVVIIIIVIIIVIIIIIITIEFFSAPQFSLYQIKVRHSYLEN